MNENGIKRILLPVDFSETSDIATTNAVILAKQLKAEVFLLSVIEPNWHPFASVMETLATPITLIDIENAVTKKINELQEKLSKKLCVKTKVIITKGRVHSEILSYAEKKKIDLIVMGTHGVSGYNDLFIGSITKRVVTLSTIPVLTMQKRCNKPDFKNILIPIDNSMHSREKVNMAIIFAKLFNATIHIIARPDSKDPVEINKFSTKIRSVEDHLSSANIPYLTTRVQSENLAQSAIDYAAKNKIDLIIINTGHESKITGFLLGAFAQQLVNHSKIPVLSIKHTLTHYRADSPGIS
jgi:nucleotide-binding universal stress UspA family protein